MKGKRMSEESAPSVAHWLVIGDPHFMLRDIEATNLMVDEILRVAKSIKERVGQNLRIVCLGDVLDTHAKIHMDPLCRSTRFLLSLVEVAPLWLLIGNHDRINNQDFQTDSHPFLGLEKTLGVTIVSKTTVEIVDSKTYIFVPYVSPGRFNEALASVEAKDPVLIFAHQEFAGVKMGKMVSTDGDQWPLTAPTVINGHIHERQRSQENIICIGSPRTIGFGSQGKKGVSEFTFVNGVLTETFHELKEVTKVIECLDYKSAITYVPPLGASVKLKVRLTSSEISVFKNCHSERLERLGVKLQYVIIDSIPKPSNVTDIVRKSFQDHLWESLDNAPHLKELYVKLWRSG